MKKLISLLVCTLFLFSQAIHAQNISGVINSYAAVTNISGSGISVNSSNALLPFLPEDRILVIQMKGASIDQSNTSSFGNITDIGGAGTFEFATIFSVNGTSLTLSSVLSNTYNFASGNVQIVRVPRFCNPVVTASLTAIPWTTTGSSARTGGVLAFEAGTLTLNSDIDVSAQGFNGGFFTAGSFMCDNGNFAGAAGTNGGEKGEGISAYIGSLNGLKGKQANGGGASNSSNSGAGGGGNAGVGGFGGNQYSGCDSTFDDRGIGALNLTPSVNSLFMGGGGGGGFKDNGLVATAGGNGGGIIFIKANAIIANNHVISANGGSVTILSDAEGAGGGGAGGTIFIECNNITGSLTIQTNGGSGGSNNNTAFVSDCHGTGGGGAGGLFAFTGATMPSNISYSSTGGPAGIIENTASACYNTTYGATAGTNGVTLSGLSNFQQTFTGPATLSITPSNTICLGESEQLIVDGGVYYSWSNGSTNSVIVVSPTVTTAYTVTGAGSGTNSCETSISTTLSISRCTDISSFNADNGLRIYPNPTNGKFSFETKTSVGLIICNELGETLSERSFQKGNYTLDISNYKSGVYFIKVLNGWGASVIKLIKTEQ